MAQLTVVGSLMLYASAWGWGCSVAGWGSPQEVGLFVLRLTTLGQLEP